MKLFMPALRLFLTLLILTSVVYPLLVTLAAQTLFPKQANGSLVYKDSHVTGSELIAQPFKNDSYFWPRPSAVDYDPLKPSGGSNLSPASTKLKDFVHEQAKKYHTNTKKIPSDLLYASGSGLDPHITIEAAYFQIPRIAKARGISEDKLKQLVDQLSQAHKDRYVNVLNLNLAINKQFKGKNESR